jgi:hypothetical protein
VKKKEGAAKVSGSPSIRVLEEDWDVWKKSHNIQQEPEKGGIMRRIEQSRMSSAEPHRAPSRLGTLNISQIVYMEPSNISVGIELISGEGYR